MEDEIAPRCLGDRYSPQTDAENDCPACEWERLCWQMSRAKNRDKMLNPEKKHGGR